MSNLVPILTLIGQISSSDTDYVISDYHTNKMYETYYNGQYDCEYTDDKYRVVVIGNHVLLDNLESGRHFGLYIENIDEFHKLMELEPIAH